jgi:hypothetical protein
MSELTRLRGEVEILVGMLKNERDKVAKMQTLVIDRHINIPITDWDLGEFRDIVYKNKSFQWSFDTEYGEKIWVNFMSEDELEQRER